MNYLITSTRRVNKRTAAAIQAALDKEFGRPICTIFAQKKGIEYVVNAAGYLRGAYVYAFITGFLAARGLL